MENKSALAWYTGCFKKYATFAGRAQRSEYWFFQLFHTIASILIGVSAVSAASTLTTGETGLAMASNAILSIYCLAALLPNIAVLVRRLHDTGRSGWWFWISAVPLVGGIVLLIFLCTDSQAGNNQFGDNPKESAAPTPAAA